MPPESSDQFPGTIRLGDLPQVLLCHPAMGKLSITLTPCEVSMLSFPNCKIPKKSRDKMLRVPAPYIEQNIQVVLTYNRAVSLTTLTIHFPLICQDDFSPAARRVDCQRLLKALVNFRRPHTICFQPNNFFVVLQ